MDVWSGQCSALGREEDKQLTTFTTDWGQYRHGVALQGYAPSNDGYLKRQDRNIELVKPKTKVAEDMVTWKADQDLEARRWSACGYRALRGKLGVILNGANVQSRGNGITMAEFRVSGQKVEPSCQYLKPMASSPTSSSGGNV